MKKINRSSIVPPVITKKSLKEKFIDRFLTATNQTSYMLLVKDNLDIFIEDPQDYYRIPQIMQDINVGTLVTMPSRMTEFSTNYPGLPLLANLTPDYLNYQPSEIKQLAEIGDNLDTFCGYYLAIDADEDNWKDKLTSLIDINNYAQKHGFITVVNIENNSLNINELMRLNALIGSTFLVASEIGNFSYDLQRTSLNLLLQDDKFESIRDLFRQISISKTLMCSGYLIEENLLGRPAKEASAILEATAKIYYDEYDHEKAFQWFMDNI